MALEEFQKTTLINFYRFHGDDMDSIITMAENDEEAAYFLNLAAYHLGQSRWYLKQIIDGKKSHSIANISTADLEYEKEEDVLVFGKQSYKKNELIETISDYFDIVEKELDLNTDIQPGFMGMFVAEVSKRIGGSPDPRLVQKLALDELERRLEGSLVS